MDYCKLSKHAFVEAPLTEIGTESAELNNIPKQHDFGNASINSPLEWDAAKKFTKVLCQSNESFSEQRRAIEMNVSAIDHHMKVSGDHGRRFVKCVGHMVILEVNK